MTAQVDLFEVAKDLSRAHASLLDAGVEPTVSVLLIETGRCPSCAAPLLRGDRLSYCTGCGSEVDQC